LSAQTQIASQVIGLAADPLWSTIGGFVAVHELRKRNMIGPVADDVLYAGIIAINSARTAPIAQLAGAALGLDNVILPAAAGAVGAKLFGPAAAGAAGAAGGAAVTKAAAGAATRTTIKQLAVKGAKLAVPVAVTALVATETDKAIYARLSKADKIAWKRVPFWKRIIPVVGTLAIKQAQKEVRAEQSGLE
jgi:hypothetical protein